MSFFGGISEAKTSAGGNYISPGVYLLRVAKLIAKAGRKGSNLFIAEFEVVTSQGDDKTKKPGTTASWVVNLTQHEAGLGNVKQFLAAAAGVKEEAVNENGATAAVSAEQPLTGIYVLAQAENIKTKAEKDFTKMFWQHVPKENLAQCQAAYAAAFPMKVKAA